MSRGDPQYAMRYPPTPSLRPPRMNCASESLPSGRVYHRKQVKPADRVVPGLRERRHEGCFTSRIQGFQEHRHETGNQHAVS
jgi:hypothetical protein